MASAILAASVVGIFAPLSASYQQTAVAQQRSVAGSLAEQLLEEISAKPYVDPTDALLRLGPETEETSRSLYDNVDDYHGYSDSTASLQSLSGASVAWSGEGRYERRVSAEYRASPSGSAVSSGDFLVVTVTVRTPRGDEVSVQRLRTRYPQAP